MEALSLCLGSYTTFNTFMLLRFGSDPVSLLFAKFLQEIALSENRYLKGVEGMILTGPI
jgi:hypothetical protein